MPLLWTFTARRCVNFAYRRLQHRYVLIVSAIVLTFTSLFFSSHLYVYNSLFFLNTFVIHWIIQQQNHFKKKLFFIIVTDKKSWLPVCSISMNISFIRSSVLLNHWCMRMKVHNEVHVFRAIFSSLILFNFSIVYFLNVFYFVSNWNFRNKLNKKHFRHFSSFKKPSKKTTNFPLNIFRMTIIVASAVAILNHLNKH